MALSRRTLLPSAALAAVLLAACGDDDGAAVDEPTEEPTADTTGSADPVDEDAASDAGTVSIERSRYAPETLELAVGSRVTFENLDPFAHTVTSTEGSAVEFDSGQLEQDASFEQTFDEAGSYEYFCRIHPTMRAEVVVS